MTRRSWWRLAASAALALLATRVVWLAWRYYFQGGPRFRVESAAIALVIVGVVVVLLRPGGQSEESAESRQIEVRWLPLFVLAAACLYGPALGIGLLSDDYTLRAMAQSEGLGAGSGWFFRPVPLLLWRALGWIGGSAVLLHAASLLLHGLNAFLVARLGGALGMRRAAALGGAALFLSFPAAAEAVVWAAGIQDVLMTTLALAAVVAASGRAPSGARIALVCLLVGLGLGSKETAVCIPVLIAICWMTPSRLREDWRVYAALAVVTGGYLAMRVPMGFGDAYLVPPSRYLLKQMIVIAFGTLVTPWRAPASALEQWRALGAVVVPVLLLVQGLLSWRRADARLHRVVRLAAWVLAAVAPVYALFFVSPLLEGSRYLYLAECGWALLVAELVSAASERMPSRSLVFGCVIGAAVLVSVLSVEHEIGVWRRAAELRDRVLEEARAAIARQGCSAATFAQLPVTRDGAYVFGNGFPEALGLPRGSAPPECSFVWSDDRFIAALYSGR